MQAKQPENGEFESEEGEWELQIGDKAVVVQVLSW
jgi:hypothetical protein